MTVSMTGFGQAQAHRKGERFTVTLKSVNHRYFETSLHLPVGMDYLEALVRSKIQEKVRRGRVTVSVNYSNDSAEQVVLNEDLIRSYFRALESVRHKLKLSQGVGIGELVSLPGVLTTKKDELRATERQALVRQALGQALQKLVAMRRHEGEALGADLRRRVKRIGAHMATIKKQVAAVLDEKKKTLSNEELESFLRSTDVSEEMTRIDFHLKSFLKQMAAREPMGKVLDFIGQELQREINTLGAKVQDKHVAYQVVMIKDQIEKIREQVQNVE